MTRQQLLDKKDRLPASAVTVGFPLAALWALHAAAIQVPGAGYVRFPILFGTAAAFLLWRLSRPNRSPKSTHKNGITFGLCCWGVAATLSTILNWNTSQVPLTYISVFLAGGAVYMALSGLQFTQADLDAAIVGLAFGTLFPLIAGLVAFVGEWGIPDIGTTISAWQNIARMESYSDATFGNRGNTAVFILIVTPILLATLFDKRKGLAMRALCGATLVLIALNLLVLQVRAAFVTMLFVIVLVWAFKLGARRLPVFAAAVVLGIVLLFKFQPDVGVTMTERLLPAVTVDTGGDESVQGRVDAIQEGWGIALRNWLLGIGPGGALTVHSRESAHQFQVQQAMETGIFGLVGVTILSIGVWVSLIRIVVRGRNNQLNDTRFMLIIGPAAYITYSVIANAALNNASVNTWTVLVASMLGLMPPFERMGRRVRGRGARLAQRHSPATEQLLAHASSLPAHAR